MSFRRLNILYILWLIVLVILAVHSLVYGDTAMLHSFNRGEVTPKLLARSDVKVYYSGNRVMENFYCQVHGGASKRPGTYFISEVNDSDNVERLISLSQSTERNYVLVMGEKTIGFYLGD